MCTCVVGVVSVGICIGCVVYVVSVGMWEVYVSMHVHMVGMVCMVCVCVYEACRICASGHIQVLGPHHTQQAGAQQYPPSL